MSGAQRGQPPARVRVTRTRRAATDRHRPLREEVDAQSALGTAYVVSLMRAQRRLSLRLVLALGTLLLVAPLLVLLVPAAGRLTVLSVPLPWLVLGVLVYPAVIAAAAWFTRSSERLEGDFARVVDRG